MLDLAYARRRAFLKPGRFWTVFYRMKRKLGLRV